MVFGNKGDGSATGVAFTRDPSTGEQGLYGEFLVNAQGEDVVAGIRTPEPLERMEERLPEAFAQLLETMAALERHYRDVQDIEFTVEEGALYLLQTRIGEAHRRRGAEGGGRDGRGGPDLPGGGGGADRPGAARPAPAPDARPERELRGRREGPERLAGRGVGQDRLRRRDGRAERGPSEPVILVRWETTPDDYARHARGRGDPDRARRAHLARRGRRARRGASRASSAAARSRSTRTPGRRRSASTSCTRATCSRSTAAAAT